jgi:hypothetical protein
MSTKQSETLNQILTDVLANRKNLADQLATQKQQIDIATAQLEKFDTLIATLQVVTLAPNVLDAVVDQEAANALVSPISAAGASNDVAPAVESEQTEAVSANA